MHPNNPTMIIKVVCYQAINYKGMVANLFEENI